MRVSNWCGPRGNAQPLVAQELEGVHARLKAPGANLRSVEAVILPLYHNERYFKVQLEKLQALHARLSPAQRAQILKALS